MEYKEINDGMPPTEIDSVSNYQYLKKLDCPLIRSDDLDFPPILVSETKIDPPTEENELNQPNNEHLYAEDSLTSGDERKPLYLYQGHQQSPLAAGETPLDRQPSPHTFPPRFRLKWYKLYGGSSLVPPLHIASQSDHLSQNEPPHRRAFIKGPKGKPPGIPAALAFPVRKRRARRMKSIKSSVRKSHIRPLQQHGPKSNPFRGPKGCPPGIRYESLNKKRLASLRITPSRLPFVRGPRGGPPGILARHV